MQAQIFLDIVQAVKHLPTMARLASQINFIFAPDNSFVVHPTHFPDTTTLSTAQFMQSLSFCPSIAEYNSSCQSTYY